MAFRCIQLRFFWKIFFFLSAPVFFCHRGKVDWNVCASLLFFFGWTAPTHQTIFLFATPPSAGAKANLLLEVFTVVLSQGAAIRPLLPSVASGCQSVARSEAWTKQINSVAHKISMFSNPGLLKSVKLDRWSLPAKAVWDSCVFTQFRGGLQMLSGCWIGWTSVQFNKCVCVFSGWQS